MHSKWSVVVQEWKESTAGQVAGKKRWKKTRKTTILLCLRMECWLRRLWFLRFFLLQIGSCKIDVVEVMESVATLVPKVLFFGGLAPPPTRWAVVDWPRNWRSQNLRRNRSKSNVISNHIFSNSIWVRLESSFHRRSPLVERLEATLLLRKETR